MREPDFTDQTYFLKLQLVFETVTSDKPNKNFRTLKKILRTNIFYNPSGKKVKLAKKSIDEGYVGQKTVSSDFSTVTSDKVNKFYAAQNLQKTFSVTLDIIFKTVTSDKANMNVRAFKKHKPTNVGRTALEQQARHFNSGAVAWINFSWVQKTFLPPGL